MAEQKRLGLALCGSYCTYEKLFQAAESLAGRYELVPIMSDTAAETDSRFGRASEHIRHLMELTGQPVITTIAEAEPLGPARPLDALLIAPCTGNTLAKLSHGITDSAVTMAAKAHLRNGRPLILALSTNDGLTGSAENIGRLLNRKHYYFGQETLLPAGGFPPYGRDRGGRPGGKTAPAGAAALRAEKVCRARRAAAGREFCGGESSPPLLFFLFFYFPSSIRISSGRTGSNLTPYQWLSSPWVFSMHSTV